MSYPKPLSEKSLARMYREANIDEKKSDFLHKLFLASANLYGIVILHDIWEIYKVVAEQYGMKGIKLKEIVAFSSIVRREDVPYYVYEIDELYSEEKRTVLDREIVMKSLIFPNNKRLYYWLCNLQGDKPYFIPDDLLSFVKPAPTKEEKELLTFLRPLKVTSKVCDAGRGTIYPNEHTGEKIGRFSFLTVSEKNEYKYIMDLYEKCPAKYENMRQNFLRKTSGTEAEKLARKYKEQCSLGFSSNAENINYIIKELDEVGVNLNNKQTERLVELLMNVNNHINHWCNRGWTPLDLLRETGIPDVKTVSLGPEIKRHIAEGKVSYEELREYFDSMGIKLEE